MIGKTTDSSQIRVGRLGRVLSGRRRSWMILSSLAVLSSVVLLTGLSGGSLANWDEAVYAQVAKEMVKSGDWFTPHYAGQPYFDKPPLVIWLVALAYSLFGISEFSSRILPAIFGVLVVILVVHFGSRLFDTRTGVIAGIILLWNTVPSTLEYPFVPHGYLENGMTPFSFVWMSRSLMLEIPLTFFSVLTLWTFWESKKQPRFLLVTGLAAGLGFMTKGAEFLPTLLIIILFMGLSSSWRKMVRRRTFLFAIAIFLLVALPWHALQIVMNGQSFINSYLWQHVALHVLTSSEGHGGSYLYYFGVLLQVFGFWILAGVSGLIIVLRQYLNDKSERTLLFLLWLLVPLLLFTAAQTKLPWYAAPSYPAVAILIGRTLSDFSRQLGKVAQVGSIATVAGFVGSFPLLAVAIIAVSGAYIATKMLKGVWQGRLRSLVPLLLVVFIVVAGLRTFPPPDHTPNTKAVALMARNLVPNSTLLLLYPGNMPSALFYSDRNVTVVWDQTEFITILRSNPGAYIITNSTCDSMPSGVNLTAVFRSDDILLLKNSPGTCFTA